MVAQLTQTPVFIYGDKIKHRDFKVMKTNHSLENLLEFAAALSQQKNYDEILRLVAQQAAKTVIRKYRLFA